MARSAYFHTDEFVTYRFSDSHPLQQRRLVMTHRLLDSYGHFDGIAAEVVAPNPATTDDLAAVHSPEYIEAVRTISDTLSTDPHAPIDRGLANRHGLGAGDNPAFPWMWEAGLLYVGASLECADRILAGTNVTAFNPSGGLHHAMRDRATGFCLFNDCAIVAKRLIAAGKRVACLDVLDAHHGDGTQALLYDEPEALTVSFHESGRTLFPGTGFTDEIGVGPGAGYSVNIPMEMASSDAQYARTFDEVVAPLLDAYRPDVIVLMVGADSHFQDPLAHLRLSSHGWTAVADRVVALGLPTIALGSGGYNLRTVPRLWAMLQASLAGVTLPDDIPEPFPREHGLTQLHDIETPQQTPTDQRNADDKLTANIRAVREAVFPVHGLRV